MAITGLDTRWASAYISHDDIPRCVIGERHAIAQSTTRRLFAAIIGIGILVATVSVAAASGATQASATIRDASGNSGRMGEVHRGRRRPTPRERQGRGPDRRPPRDPPPQLRIVHRAGVHVRGHPSQPARRSPMGSMIRLAPTPATCRISSSTARGAGTLTPSPTVPRCPQARCRSDAMARRDHPCGRDDPCGARTTRARRRPRATVAPDRLRRGRRGDRGDGLSDEMLDLGRFAEPSMYILVSLSDGPKHGYAIMTDVEEITGSPMGPGTLYGALARLERRGLIEALEPVDRRRPYRLTGRRRSDRPRPARATPGLRGDRPRPAAEHLAMTALLRLYPRRGGIATKPSSSALLAARARRSLGDRLDIVRGALDARLHPQVPGSAGTRPATRRRVPVAAGLATLSGAAWLAWVAAALSEFRGWDGPMPTNATMIMVLGAIAGFLLAGAHVAVTMTAGDRSASDRRPGGVGGGRHVRRDCLWRRHTRHLRAASPRRSLP